MWRGWNLTLALVLLLTSAAYCQDTNSNVKTEDKKIQTNEAADFKKGDTRQIHVNEDNIPASAVAEDASHIETNAEDNSQTTKKADELKSAGNKTPVQEQAEVVERKRDETELLRQQRLAEVERIKKKEKIYGKRYTL